MATTMILTFTAHDRPGVVELLSKTVALNGGNWLESRMAHLAERFAGVARIDVADHVATGLEKSLLALKEEGFHIFVERTSPVAVEQAATCFELDVVGPDRSGLMMELTKCLASLHISVEEMETSIKPAPVSGGTFFHAKIIFSASVDMDEDDLADKLQSLGETMHVDMDLSKSALL